MKKKLAILLGNARVTGNARFKTLYQKYQSAADALDKAKSEKTSAKKAYHQAVQEGKSGSDHFELLIGFRKAKFWRQYQRADFQLAQHHLAQWIEEFEQKNNSKTAAKNKKVANKGKKSAPAGKASRSSAKPLNKKAVEKDKKQHPTASAPIRPAKKTAKNKPTA